MPINSRRLFPGSLEQLMEELDHSRIYAPFDGYITAISSGIKEGGIVQMNQVIARISEDDSLYVQYIGDKAGYFKVGMEVEVVCAPPAAEGSNLGSEYIVQLTKITNAANIKYKGIVVETPGQPMFWGDYPKQCVKVRVENNGADVGLGDEAIINAVLGRAENAAKVPAIAVKSIQAAKYVYVLKDGVREERKVKTGLETAYEIEIIEGVEEGEEVFLN